VSPPVTQLHPLAQTVFRDTYLLDFLDLPETHSELELQQALVAKLRKFLLELGGLAPPGRAMTAVVCPMRLIGG